MFVHLSNQFSNWVKIILRKKPPAKAQASLVMSTDTVKSKADGDYPSFTYNNWYLAQNYVQYDCYSYLLKMMYWSICSRNAKHSLTIERVRLGQSSMDGSFLKALWETLFGYDTWTGSWFINIGRVHGRKEVRGYERMTLLQWWVGECLQCVS